QIYAAKGFEGEVLDQIVEVITSDHERWIDTMITEEFGLPLEHRSPVKAGLSTFGAFSMAGLIPLLPFFFAHDAAQRGVFATSATLTCLTFFAVGLAKGAVVHQPLVKSGAVTLALGSAAAALAYGIGASLRYI